MKDIYKSVKKHCLECSGSVSEVLQCPQVECNLYPFRTGNATEAKIDASESKENG